MGLFAGGFLHTHRPNIIPHNISIPRTSTTIILRSYSHNTLSDGLLDDSGILVDNQ